MSTVVAVFGLIVGLFGIAGLFWPQGLVGMMTGAASPTGHVLAVLARLAIGVVLLLAAPACRWPRPSESPGGRGKSISMATPYHRRG